ncbi:hypothetical protein V1505DRAFT_382115 [Lipomyces doorenjongii]
MFPVTANFHCLAFCSACVCLLVHWTLNPLHLQLPTFSKFLSSSINFFTIYTILRALLPSTIYSILKSLHFPISIISI